MNAHPPVNAFRLEAISAARTAPGEWMFPLAMLAGGAGFVLLMFSSRPGLQAVGIALGLCAAGFGIVYARTAPGQYTYADYFWLSEQGIHYREALYPWDHVTSVSINPVGENELPALCITTRNPLRDSEPAGEVERTYELSMASGTDATRALQAIREVLARPS